MPARFLLLHFLSHALSPPLQKEFFFIVFVVIQKSYLKSTISSPLSFITISEAAKEPTKAKVQKVASEDDGEWLYLIEAIIY